MATNLVSAIPTSAAELGIGQGDFGRKFAPGTSVLLSIFPIEMHDMSKHAGRTPYLHPAAAKDKIIELTMNPARLSVQTPDLDQPLFFLRPKAVNNGRGYTLISFCDTYQWVNNPERERREPLPIEAVVVAQAYESMWIQGQRTRSGRIGIKVLNRNEPFEEQLRFLWDGQIEYFRSLVEEADKSELERDRKYITQIHRAAAAWLGIENREWFKPMGEQHMKKCPACASSILAEALVCIKCTRFLPEFHVEHKIPFAHDIRVAEFIRDSNMAKQKKEN